MSPSSTWRGRPLRAEIDLDALRANVASIRQRLAPGTQIAAVVKANAYGHGAVQCARAALEGGASYLAVNLADEGVELRRAGLTCPILTLGFVAPWEAAKAAEARLTVTVNTRQLALALSAAARERGLTLPVHVKIDTGLSRYGLLPGEAPAFIAELARLPHLRWQGLWTHFANADATDKAHALRQLERFETVCRELAAQGLRPELRHTGASAGMIELAGSHFELVRPGIAIYGLYPSPEVDHSWQLLPVMSLKSVVARLRELPAGESVGYGCTHTLSCASRLALIPAGYGDGLRRSLANGGQVLIRGRRAPVVGRVSMDQFTVDVTSLPQVEEGDEVVLLGRQGQDEITAEEIGGWFDTLNYEVVTGISHRVPRLYFQRGELVAAEDMNGPQ